jgi:hypothetical protein
VEGAKAAAEPTRARRAVVNCILLVDDDVI